MASGTETSLTYGTKLGFAQFQTHQILVRRGSNASCPGDLGSCSVRSIVTLSCNHIACCPFIFQRTRTVALGLTHSRKTRHLTAAMSFLYFPSASFHTWPLYDSPAVPLIVCVPYLATPVSAIHDVHGLIPRNQISA